MAKIKKILFAVPNDRWFDNNRHLHNFPYTFGILNAVLKRDYEVGFLDAGFENLGCEQVKERISKYKPDVFGISCLSMEYTRHFQKMAEIAKSAYPETKVVIGGIYPTLLPEVLIQNPNIDYEVMGEGEYRFPRLLNELKKDRPNLEGIDGLAYRDSAGNVKIQRMIKLIQNLDDVPFPDYTGVDIEKYMGVVNRHSYFISPRRTPYAQSITSRGCPFDCIFCSSKAINGPKIRYRSAESVLAEIDSLVDRYKIKEMVFLDDNFFLDKKRLNKILDGLIKRKYDLEWRTASSAVYALDDLILEKIKLSGGYQLPLAIESGTQEGLNLIRKPLNLSKVAPIVKKARSLGIGVTGLFVIGIPGETWSQIRKTFEFAESLDLDYCSFSVATPLPKTQLYNIAKRENLLPEDFNFDALDFKGFGRATITTTEFTPEELQILRAFEWDRINFKTEEKIRKVAEIHGLTVEEVDSWRKSTRRGLGVKVRYS